MWNISKKIYHQYIWIYFSLFFGEIYFQYISVFFFGQIYFKYISVLFFGQIYLKYISSNPQSIFSKYICNIFIQFKINLIKINLKYMKLIYFKYILDIFKTYSRYILPFLEYIQGIFQIYLTINGKSSFQNAISFWYWNEMWNIIRIYLEYI